MAFGAGHVQDMNNRLKQNRAQRPSKKAKFKENNREGIHATKIQYEKPKYKTVPEKELTKLKKRIRERAKTEHKKAIIMDGILILLAILSITGMLLWFN